MAELLLKFERTFERRLTFAQRRDLEARIARALRQLGYEADAVGETRAAGAWFSKAFGYRPNLSDLLRCLRSYAHSLGIAPLAAPDGPGVR
jgi:hypothetical protein